MRFRPNMEGVTAILTDLPTEATLTRPDGAHSGNPAVREAVKNKEPQHVCWARRTGRRRSWLWFPPAGTCIGIGAVNEQFRRLILTPRWSAGVDVPANGVAAGR